MSAAPVDRKPSPLECFQGLRRFTDGVILGISGGKDSVALLDMARPLFPRVEAFFMYVVPGLSFQEQYLGYLERRYDIKIERIPHWVCSRLYKHGRMRPLTRTCPRITWKDVERQQRERTGLDWFLYGGKANDSLHRRGMYTKLQRQCGMPANLKSRTCNPLAWWTDRQVATYLKARSIPLAPDYAVWGRSFGSLDGESLFLLREYYPLDFEKLLRRFPLAGAQVAKYEFGYDTRGERKKRYTRSGPAARPAAPAEVPEVPPG